MLEKKHLDLLKEHEPLIKKHFEKALEASKLDDLVIKSIEFAPRAIVCVYPQKPVYGLDQYGNWVVIGCQ